MIEKIKIYGNVTTQEIATINQLIDAVNKQQEEINRLKSGWIEPPRKAKNITYTYKDK